MYILEVNHGGGEIHRHFLLPGQTYTLGRKECRILLPATEPSISRHHATIVVAPMPRYSVLDPTAQQEIRIEDVSKHGTFVDRERIGKDNTRFLYPEDRIRLGLRVTARLIPMLLILGISPDLTDESLDFVLDSAVRIGALVVEDVMPAPLHYYEQHTNCVGFLYVAEDSFSMEETMMQALGYGYTLVTPNYISHLVKCLEEEDTLMPSEFPVPSSPSPASPSLRAVHYRRPAQTFFSLTEFLSLGRPIMSSIFQGYTFVVVDDSIRVTYSEVVKLFGGTMEPLTLDAIPHWCSQHAPAAGSYPLTTCVLVAEDDFRVISEEVMKRGGGRGVCNTNHNHPNMGGYLRLYNCGLCLIPEENVHLSLYRNDGRELNTKATACYLQRTSEDVLSDMSSSSTTLTEGLTSTTTQMGPASRKDSGPSSEFAAAPSTTSAVPPGRCSSGPTREISQSSPMSPLTFSSVPHLVSGQTRRSRENSSLSNYSSGIHAESNEKSSSAADVASMPPALAIRLPVNAGRSGSHVGSPTVASATPSVLSAASSFRPSIRGDTVAAAAVTTVRSSTKVEAPQPTTTAPDVASNTTTTTTNKSTSSPPQSVPDCEKSAPVNAIAAVHIDCTSSSSNSATAFDVHAAPATSMEARPSANISSASKAAAPDTIKISTSTTTTTDAAVLPTTVENHPVRREASSTANDSNTSALRSRPIAHRAAHPFSLGLHPHHCSSSEDENSDEREGQDGDRQLRAPSTTELTAARGDTAATSPTAHRTAQTSAHRASTSARRPSLGMPPSPVMYPLKSEEVVWPRSRAASSSQPTVYSVAMVTLGRRSAGRSEERPPLPLSGDAPHVIEMEAEQRRCSASGEANNAGMPPPSPTSVSAATAVPAPLLQRSQMRPDAAKNNSETTTTTTPTALPIPEKTAGRNGNNNGPSATAPPSTTLAAVRRGERRLAGASVSTPRRSVARVKSNAELSALPPQTDSKAQRFTTPERDVVVHGAAQPSKSPPRQRVEAIQISTATSERRTLLSRGPDMPHSFHTDPTEETVAGGGGSMGNRRSVLRRESFSTVNRPPPPPPPASGSVARRTSSSFNRSDSAQLREMATPYRLPTSHVSSSVPRRRSKVYSSVQRQRSLELMSEETEGNGGVATTSSLLPTSGQLATAQRASIRRRRSSPTHGNGTAVPGLRGSSVATALGGPSNATAEAFFRANDELNTHCQKFMKEFIDTFMTETERVTRAVVRQTYMDAPGKETLEGGVERISEFLQYMNRAESDIPCMYSTSSTRAACHQVRQKAHYTLSKIKNCYKMVNCKIPSSLSRARAALSTRGASPMQRRLNSAAPELGSVRR